MKLFIASFVTLALSTLICVRGDSSSLRGGNTRQGWPRIVGGTHAAQGEYPFFVQWGDRICGASLVAPDVVLSAAHCADFGGTEVWIGGTRASKAGGDDGGIMSNIIRSTMVKHPLFDEDNSLRYDFMVMKLNSNVTQREFIKLNSLDEIPAVENGIEANLDVMGYGTQEAIAQLPEYGLTYDQPEILQHLTVQYTPASICKSQHDSLLDLNIMFCAGVYGGGKGTCLGDSGGPIIEYINSEPYQVGIVSWGRGCALRSYHAVYARVSGAFDWIKEQICSLSDNAPDYLECEDDPLDASSDPAPTQAPESGEGDGNVTVLVEFRTDNHPEETTWSIGSYLHYDGDFFSGDEHTYKYQITMVPGPYTLDIQDSVGDGFCCTHGEGYIKVAVERPDGTIVTLLNTEGKDVYSDTASLQFTVPADDENIITPAPTATPSANPSGRPSESPSGSPGYLDCEDGDPLAPSRNPASEPENGEDVVKVRVEFRTDKYPEETSWTIPCFLHFDGDASSGDERIYMYELSMAPGIYTVELRDSLGDGFCCAFGEGYIKISVERPDGTIITLLDTEGENVFGSEASLQFTVPADDEDLIVLDFTPAPTAAPGESGSPTDGNLAGSTVTAPTVFHGAREDGM